MKRAASSPISLISSEEEEESVGNYDNNNNGRKAEKKDTVDNARVFGALYGVASSSSSDESDESDEDYDSGYIRSLVPSLDMSRHGRAVSEVSDDDDDDANVLISTYDPSSLAPDTDGSIHAAAAEIQRRFLQIKQAVDKWTGDEMAEIINIKQFPPLNLTRDQFNRTARVLAFEMPLFFETPIISSAGFVDILIEASRRAHMFFTPLFTRIYRQWPAFRPRSLADQYICFGPFLVGYLEALRDDDDKAAEEEKLHRAMGKPSTRPIWEFVPMMLRPRNHTALTLRGIKLLGKTPDAKRNRGVVRVLKTSIINKPVELAAALLSANWPQECEHERHVVDKVMDIVIEDKKQGLVQDARSLVSWLLVWKSIGLRIPPRFFHTAFHMLPVDQFSGARDVVGDHTAPAWVQLYALHFEGAPVDAKAFFERRNQQLMWAALNKANALPSKGK